MKHTVCFSLIFFLVMNPSAGFSQESSAPSPIKKSEERVIGETIHSQILSAFQVYTEPEAVSYVNGIGKNLSAHAQRKNLDYQVTVLYSEKFYATSAPGGHVYVTTGMINFLQNESELAGVLAHEIGQLQYQDPRLSKSKKVMESLTRNGAKVAPVFGTFGMLAALGLAMLNKTVDADGATPEEKLFKADRYALEYMLEAGYDPQAFLDLQYRLTSATSDIVPYFYDYYQSRPLSMARWNSIFKAFQQLPLEGKALSTNREDFLSKTKGIRQIHIPAS